MLQTDSAGLFNTLIPKAHNSECQNLPFPLQVRQLKVNLIKPSWRNFTSAPSALMGYTSQEEEQEGPTRSKRGRKSAKKEEDISHKEEDDIDVDDIDEDDIDDDDDGGEDSDYVPSDGEESDKVGAAAWRIFISGAHFCCGRVFEQTPESVLWVNASSRCQFSSHGLEWKKALFLKLFIVYFYTLLFYYSELGTSGIFEFFQ